MSTHILVAEDDAHIRDGLKDTLELEGYTVTVAADGKEALQLADEQSFGLIILDIMMPEINGYEVCREIRRHDPAVPIIMLTAKGEEIDKVLGLELGADDYVTKPFGIRELLARIAAVLRRTQPRRGTGGEELADEFKFGQAVINRRAFKGELNGKTFRLSARAMELLKIFHQHPGEVLSREELLRMAWEVDYGGYTRTLDQHVSQLRKKIEADSRNPTVIITVHGIGYRYDG